ncbi:MAG: hypothetical protein DWH83_07690 [Planctomycetota bacterium]|jgi:hypothetical protein|nr:MAG: hypothetical protein DWH83_07690 [Planctomycetota bacterium]
MKFRSALLCVCMLVVPAAAMFSHRIPADLRAMMRERFAVAVRSWAGQAGPGKAVETVAAGEPLPAGSGSSGGMLPVADRGPPAVGTTAGAEPRAEELLGRLGAVGLECRPLNGTAGMHVASCSVAIDDSGQLLRVFHASGANPAAATQALCDEVNGWKRRLTDRGRAALTPPSVTGAGAAGQRL